ncbi:hypothetical protein NKR23_g2610 [Pleurostoma richardsiae]|uniref:Uncharacterized protein n=1 Tax=Pleurostoma richardsiae TaxID=41990 RepID=A0AA38RPX3_9PEZI|nr:hypothetical protein NKR23_g2610 [Pleurostoma richardsiae]
MTFSVPEISQADLYSFYETHFSSDAIGIFEAQFLAPVGTYVGGTEATEQEEEYEYFEEDDDDDGLGYYADGVKRTLTDEQIAMFRHSEMEALKKAVASAKLHTPVPVETAKAARDNAWDEGEVFSDGEIAEARVPPEPAEAKKSNKKKRKRGKGGGRNNHAQELKPDLRKRTWDVVETGLVESLNYDEVEGDQAVTGRSAQRRHISYDDD